MARYVTSMGELGFHTGMSMLEILASTRFIQGFDLLETSAKSEVSSFVASQGNEADLNYLRRDIEDLLEFETEKDMRHYFYLIGASYWPPNESIKDTFTQSLQEIDERLGKRSQHQS